MNFSITPGVNITRTTTIPEHRLGQRITGLFGANNRYGEYVYIRANNNLVALHIYELPLLTTDAYRIDTSLSKTSAATFAGAQFRSFAACIPEVAMVTGEYGWAFVKGTGQVIAAAAIAANTRLALTASSAGKVDDADRDYELLNTQCLEAAGAINDSVRFFCPQDLTIYRNAA